MVQLLLDVIGKGAAQSWQMDNRGKTMVEDKFDFGLLDVNLGAETSAAIAAALKARGVPFVFATGYGDSTAFLGDYPASPVVNKPYGVEQLVKALAGMGAS